MSSATSAPPFATGAPTVEAPSPFHVAAVASDEGETLAIHALGSTLFVADATGGVLLEARGDELVWEPRLLAGLPRDFWSFENGAGYTIFDVAGSWPDAAWVVTIPGGDPRMGGFRIHCWTRDHWEAQPRLLRVAIGRYGWIRSLGGKRVFATYGANRLSANERPVLQVIHGPSSGVVPRMPCFEPDLPRGGDRDLAQAAGRPVGGGAAAARARGRWQPREPVADRGARERRRLDVGLGRRQTRHLPHTAARARRRHSRCGGAVEDPPRPRTQGSPAAARGP